MPLELALCRDGDVMDFGHGGDFLQFKDTAAIADVQIDDVCGKFLEDLPELGFVVYSSSPVTIGRLIPCFASARPLRSREETGSSYQYGR